MRRLRRYRQKLHSSALLAPAAPPHRDAVHAFWFGLKSAPAAVM